MSIPLCAEIELDNNDYQIRVRVGGVRLQETLPPTAIIIKKTTRPMVEKVASNTMFWDDEGLKP